MQNAVVFEPRVVCPRCRRPESVCYCRHITPLDTATRVVLLQHPRERDMPIGTARMASLCLTNAELHVGVHWRGSAALAGALSDPTRPPILLYPGLGAIDVLAHPPPGPTTLIVVDGTWSQAKKVVKENPELAALPRYAFRPPRPSEYRIRREPDVACVSTIEALVHVLSVLEKDGERFHALLRPFRAMVDAQLEHAGRLQGGRSRHKAKATRRPPRAPAALRERAGDLVCVVGEANAWPYRSPERTTAYPDELVQWVAHRPATGETFEFVLAPANPISPRTPLHTGLGRETLLRGGTMSELDEGWRAFVRETDVICSWGRYATSLFAARGGYLPPTHVDLRQTARDLLKRKVGTVEAFVQHIGVQATPPLCPGRAGTRLAQAVRITRYFETLGSESAAAT